MYYWYSQYSNGFYPGTQVRDLIDFFFPKKAFGCYKSLKFCYEIRIHSRGFKCRHGRGNFTKDLLCKKAVCTTLLKCIYTKTMLNALLKKTFLFPYFLCNLFDGSDSQCEILFMYSPYINIFTWKSWCNFGNLFIPDREFSDSSILTYPEILKWEFLPISWLAWDGPRGLERERDMAKTTRIKYDVWSDTPFLKWIVDTIPQCFLHCILAQFWHPFLGHLENWMAHPLAMVDHPCQCNVEVQF